MCRMIAFASAEPRDVAPYLKHLARFCESGHLVARWEKHPGGNHPDGWGIAYREGDEIRVVRSGKPAATDPLLSRVRVRTDRFIGHVRFASNPETVNARNSHPFAVMGLAMAHTIIDEDLYDEEFVGQWVVGFDEIKKHVEAMPPERAEEITSVPADQIKELARLCSGQLSEGLRNAYIEDRLLLGDRYEYSSEHLGWQRADHLPNQ
jgi:hypothetical protein